MEKGTTYPQYKENKVISKVLVAPDIPKAVQPRADKRPWHGGASDEYRKISRPDTTYQSMS